VTCHLFFRTPGSGFSAQELHLGGAGGTRGAALAVVSRVRRVCIHLILAKAWYLFVRSIPLSCAPARSKPP
jgi:hypothetical protein